MKQLELFGNDDGFEEQPQKLGHAQIEYKEARSILTEAKGFMGAYDYTLNPYSGCSFGCTYCYAAFFARSEEERNNWGYWVKVKENALKLLKKFRKKPLENKTIYLSSVTDPYQPIERKLKLTRRILEELLDYHDVRLVIQTRSQIATRDIDLFQRFKVIQVNMTVTTDSEEVRKAFEPLCPSNKVRLKAIKEINEAGVSSCITMTPLLPLESPRSFAQELLDTGIEKFIIQPFHADRGKFVAGTREDAMTVIKKYNWGKEGYEAALKVIKEYIPNIGEGKKGFAPI
jgi:DNA repair photolyase